MTTKPIDHREIICFELLGQLDRRGQELASDDACGALDYGDLEHVGVAWKPTLWVGRKLARVEHRAFCRVAATMESAGMVERIAAGFSNRTTHLRPGRAMIEKAAELTEGAADLDAIAKGLEVTAWGVPLADVARKAADDE